MYSIVNRCDVFLSVFTQENVSSQFTVNQMFSEEEEKKLADVCMTGNILSDR